MRRVLMLAVCGAGLALFGSEKSASAQCVDPGYGYGYGYGYNGGVFATTAPVFNAPVYGNGYYGGYAPAYYGNPYGGYYGGTNLYIGIGGRRGWGGGGFYGRGYGRRGWGRRW